MKSVKTTKIGLAALTILFLLLYGYFSTLGKPLPNNINLSLNNGFSNSKIIFGNIGGFHILTNVSSTDQDQYYRLFIDTELNRSTASSEKITIPYTVIEGNDTPDGYQIKVALIDTVVNNIPTNQPLAVFQGARDNEIDLIKSAQVQQNDDDSSDLIIELTKSTPFRATADSSGTIVLDILK
ncbi:TPA: hypothetical protein DIV45_02825 [Patescibacteria group bacterium]|uniref:Uncharacterized protein n=1 Tax=candidate division Kazan bacterium GW2011_GWA1_44_22 TaxID=1620410 RepID=A0A0G1I137_UNCK3|nr:MAG: hypothetical protein VE96_C0017G0004 [candidate division Kazan bacterium GW2011_GWA1_44_22]HCR42267.1 hypothetical protein [Patescibacteria group bacterium]